MDGRLGRRRSNAHREGVVLQGCHTRLQHAERQLSLYVVRAVRSSMEVCERDIVEVIGVVAIPR